MAFQSKLLKRLENFITFNEIYPKFTVSSVIFLQITSIKVLETGYNHMSIE